MLSFKHQHVQRLRRLVRKKSEREAEGVFVVEGAKVLLEAVQSGAQIESVFTAPGSSSPIVEQLRSRRTPVFELADGVIDRVADTVTPQPIMAIVQMPSHSFADVSNAASLVVLADVRDPGNAGTVMRSAEAAGIGGVVLTGNAVDVYNPKTVRASAGALFHVPVVRLAESQAAFEELRKAGFVTMGTTMTGGAIYDEADFTRRIALVFGNEANGLDVEEQAALDELVSIPIDGRSESLNVSMAASILCFEVARQRRVATRL